jgi:hypothetical protein
MFSLTPVWFRRSDLWRVPVFFRRKLHVAALNHKKIMGISSIKKRWGNFHTAESIRNEKEKIRREKEKGQIDDCE